METTNAAPKKAPGKKSKTIEETYQKKTQLEHILLRPDTYSAPAAPETARRPRRGSPPRAQSAPSR